MASGVVSTLSDEKPTAEEALHNISYQAAIAHTYEDKDEAKRRETVLLRLDQLVKAWVKHEALKKGWRADAAEHVGGRIFTSGSYRMGVHSPGSDIDVAIVVPSFIHQEDFFGSFYGILERHPDVRELSKAPWAHVPLISLYFLGIELDLLFAPLQRSTIPNNVDILDVGIIRGLDDNVIRAITGPAVAERMLKSVPNVRVFRECLRGIKLWAAHRAVYGNKYAYPNGVALAILVARVCQLYPNQCSSTIFMKFFTMYSKWFTADIERRRNNPIFLTASLTVNDPELQRLSWDASVKPRQAQEIFPVITPALPYQNACFSICRSTLRVICEEFQRGATILRQAQRQQLCRSFSSEPEAVSQPEKTPKSTQAIFEMVWAPSEFFVRYKFYLVVKIRAADAELYRRWSGTVEARLRILLIALERNNPNLHCHLYPKTFTPPCTTTEAVTKGATAPLHREGYVYVGLESTSKGKFDLTKASQEFLDDIRERERRNPLPVRMMDPALSIVPASELPTWVFDRSSADTLKEQLRVWKEDRVGTESVERPAKRPASGDDKTAPLTKVLHTVDSTRCPPSISNDLNQSTVTAKQTSQLHPTAGSNHQNDTEMEGVEDIVANLLGGG